MGFSADDHESYRRLKWRSKMATGRSLPVILKKFDQSFDPRELRAAEISKKCHVLATLSADNTLKLWNIRNDANCTLKSVTQ